MNNTLDNSPAIMGILNITPDSFYKQSRSFDFNSLNERFKLIIDSDIIDIGAESTRPTSTPLTLKEELDRLDIVFNNISIFKNKTLSIDTYKHQVAKKALENGFQIINDIYGGNSREMLLLASEFNIKIILMHIRGNPATMQNNICYSNIIDEIIDYFDARINQSIKLGVKESNIIIDPGIGFGKSLSDNYKIINNIDRFKKIGFDVMIGLSRKSFLSTNNDKPADRLGATLCANTIAMLNGADILRVHDVQEHIVLRNIINNFRNNK